MDGNNFESMMNGLPKEVRESLEGIFSGFSLNVIKSFIQQYEDDSSTDQLISRVVACVIVSIANGIEDDLKNAAKEPNPQYGRKQAAATAVKKLREIADKVESQLEVEDCSECCKHKH